MNKPYLRWTLMVGSYVTGRPVILECDSCPDSAHYRPATRLHSLYFKVQRTAGILVLIDS
jgi:hypothetical protein